MADKTELKAMACRAIDARCDEIVDVAKAIFANPEPGFRESGTADRVARKFEEWGVPFERGLALTGLKGCLQGGASGPAVAIMGELDSHIVPAHPDCNPANGWVHACGHNAQIGSMLGAGIGLLASGVLPSLSGRVALMAVPAEEYIEIEYRNGLRKQGQLEFLIGKPELIRLGAFDDVDMAMLCHTASDLGGRQIAFRGSSNGSISKFISFIGKAAHAGGRPHDGINALNAASLALQAIAMQRETFREDDYIRVHPIITRGGDSVSSVPAAVTMETFVRGRTIEAIQAANVKVDRALRAGALAIGAKVQITTLPGYMPTFYDDNLVQVIKANSAALLGPESVEERRTHGTGSTDMGDLAQIMPVVQPHVAGASGIGHGDDYRIVNYEQAVINPAKLMAMTAIDLLADGAAEARRIKTEYHAPMTRAQYLETVRSFCSEEEYAG
jgi:amidohydrolase